MGTVLLNITVSLDGFIAGENDEVERLHRWAISNAGTADVRFSDEAKDILDAREAGAIIAGRRTFDLSDGWGGNPPMKVPYIILSHDVPDKVASGEWTNFVFVSGGIEAAVAEAQKLAGGRTVSVMGGAGVAQQCLNAGLLDALQLHVVPVLLGSGIRLFEHIKDRTELELVSTVKSTETIRLWYRIIK